MTPAPAFLDDLKRATERATTAENDFRRDIAQRIKALENERAFAFRRYNLMRATADVVASAESEQIAVAGATAMLRARLGWTSDSEARAAVVTRITPVAQAMFASLAPSDDGRRAHARRHRRARRVRALVWRDAPEPVLDPVRELHAGDACCRLLNPTSR